MIRLLWAFVLLPMLLCGLVVRFTVKSRKLHILALAVLIAACAGCGVTTYALERDARQCHAEALTVADMMRCNKLYPQHNGTISDRIAQPLGELERRLF